MVQLILIALGLFYLYGGYMVFFPCERYFGAKIKPNVLFDVLFAALWIMLVLFWPIAVFGTIVLGHDKGKK